jgi:hypothetical protein
MMINPLIPEGLDEQAFTYPLSMELLPARNKEVWVNVDQVGVYGIFHK